jgi:hypothetical protein
LAAARARKLTHAVTRPSIVAAPTLSAAPAHRDGTLMLLAALALGLLALASLTLLQLLMRLGRLSHEGPAP